MPSLTSWRIVALCTILCALVTSEWGGDRFTAPDEIVLPGKGLRESCAKGTCSHDIANVLMAETLIPMRFAFDNPRLIDTHVRVTTHVPRRALPTARVVTSATDLLGKRSLRDIPAGSILVESDFERVVLDSIGGTSVFLHRDTDIHLLGNPARDRQPTQTPSTGH